MTKQEFINKVGVLAVTHSQKAKILPSLCIAQAALETGWGASQTMVNANALFGIKASASWKGKAYSSKTKECYDGVNYTTITDLFRAYDSWDESVADYYALLSGAARYAILIGETDYKEACRKIREAGYATAPNYTTVLIQIIEQNNLTEWDKKAGFISDTNTNNPMRNPMNKPYRITSKFGWRTLAGKKDLHNGFDLVPLDGVHPAELFATVDGVIEDIRATVPDSHTGLGVKDMVTGNYVNIRTKDGWLVIYRHLKANSIPANIQKGTQVKIGDKIGVMGTTGQSSGIHLHYEVRKPNSEAVDPELLMSSGITPPTPTPPQTQSSDSVTSAFAVGDKVKILSSAECYATTTIPIPEKYKNVVYTIQQVRPDRILIQELYSWVWNKDVKKA
jgi:murein DD-endopeptidase MepM/ murein hydrolase activator NlpD